MKKRFNKKDMEKMTKIILKPIYNLIDNRMKTMRMLSKHIKIFENENDVKNEAEVIYFQRFMT